MFSNLKIESFRTSCRTTPIRSRHLASELTAGTIYLSISSVASEHDWCAQFPFSVERRRRFNINDRIKELGTLLPKTNDPWVRISFLSLLLLLLLRFLLVLRHTLALLSLLPSPIATPFFVVFLFFAFAFCTFPTDHYFLFVTLYDELVQVRCSRREAFTGSPFSAPSTLLSFAFLPLSLAFHGCSFFLPLLQLCFPSSLPCKAPRFLV